MDTIKVVRSGKVRRAKLYYLRERTGKSARIAEKIKKKIGIDIETKIQQVTEENVMPTPEENAENVNKAEAPKAEVKEEATKAEAQPAQKKAPEKEQKKQEQPKEKEEQKK